MRQIKHTMTAEKRENIGDHNMLILLEMSYIDVPIIMLFN